MIVNSTPPNPAASAAPDARTSARAARQLAKLQRKVSQWWASVPPTERRSYYPGPQVAAAVGKPMTQLGPALTSLGWRREQVRLDGQQVGVWLPPGAPSMKRPVGRPSIYTLLQQGEHP